MDFAREERVGLREEEAEDCGAGAGERGVESASGIESIFEAAEVGVGFKERLLEVVEDEVRPFGERFFESLEERNFRLFDLDALVGLPGGYGERRFDDDEPERVELRESYRMKDLPYPFGEGWRLQKEERAVGAELKGDVVEVERREAERERLVESEEDGSGVGGAAAETCTERNALSERERDSRHVGKTLAEEVVGAATEVVGIRTRNRDTLLREREARGRDDLDRVEEARDRDKGRLEEVVAVGAAAYEIEPKINLTWSLKGHRHG